MDIALQKALRHREMTRHMQSLMGIVAGITADGEVNDQEILFLRTWLLNNCELRTMWPASVIAHRLDDILADGRIDKAERIHFMELLTLAQGNNFMEDGSAAAEVCQLPIEDAVTITLQHTTVCHTGTFYYGTRAACERATLRAGGLPVDTITKKTEVLVIGTNVSPHWANESFGRKIEKAVALQDQGHPVEIISEKRWIEALTTHAHT